MYRCLEAWYDFGRWTVRLWCCPDDQQQFLKWEEDAHVDRWVQVMRLAVAEGADGVLTAKVDLMTAATEGGYDDGAARALAYAPLKLADVEAAVPEWARFLLERTPLHEATWLSLPALFRAAPGDAAEALETAVRGLAEMNRGEPGATPARVALDVATALEVV